MTDDTENLLLEILKRMQIDMAELKADMSDIKLRVTAAEDHLATVVMSIAGISHRLDRLADRVGRIDTRLDLSESM